MHRESYKKMEKFVKDYLDTKKAYRIIDIGSLYVFRCYRNIFEKNSLWDYKGADLVAGRNVDIVLQRPYNWNIEDDAYDVVISGQVLEHVPDMKSWIKEIKRITKIDGLICIIAPWEWPLHPAPQDCWRILPNGMEWLLKVAELDIFEVYMEGHDTVGIAKKNK